MFSLSNTVKNKFQRSIPYKKRKQSYPAVLIGQLGVDTEAIKI